MHRAIIAVLFILLGLGCAEKPQDQEHLSQEKKGGIKSFWTELSIDSSLLIQELDSFEMLYAAELLSLAEEENLNRYSPKFSIRMIYADSWAPAIVQRISLMKDSMGVTMLELKSRGVRINSSGQYTGTSHIGGETSHKMERYFKFHPQFNLVDSLKGLLLEYSLYGMHTRANHDGDDGNDLFLEMLIDGEYHVIHRWTPRLSKDPQDQQLLEFCRYFISLQSKGIDRIDDWKREG